MIDRTRLLSLKSPTNTNHERKVLNFGVIDTIKENDSEDDF